MKVSLPGVRFSGTGSPDELVQALYGYLCAAPQARAEYERGHADGWAAGWNQAIKQPQADKDGGQQRAGDGKTREAVDYPRGGALNFDDAAPAGADDVVLPPYPSIGFKDPAHGYRLMHHWGVKVVLADRQRRAGDAQNAARWRWVRQHWGRIVDIYEKDSAHVLSIEVGDETQEGWYTDPESLDAAVDAAMSAQEGEAC